MIKSYDSMAWSGYIRFSRKPVAYTKEVTGNMLCDFDVDDQIIGIELIECVPNELEKVEMVMEKSKLISV